MPNFRFRLPSRNWLIFIAIASSFTGALVYDRREKRKVQDKWCTLVAHIAKEPLQTREMRRKITVFLSAPPGDSLYPAREHFKEYVKPVLVAAAMDYDVVEGRREGDVRAALANRIRKERRRAGEGSPAPGDEEDLESQVKAVRSYFDIHDEAGERGDLVIGRNTWKEYVRGIHEGWLGPLEPPPTPHPAPSEADDAGSTPSGEEASQAQKEPEKKKEGEKEKPKAQPAFVLPWQYPSNQLAPSTPRELQPATPIIFPHLLGILNTPIRIYRFLTQRRLADNVGRDIAAIVLATSTRPYSEIEPNILDLDQASSDTSITTESTSGPTKHYEQQYVLANEEKEWHKSVHRASDDPNVKESEWLDKVVIDPRLGSRMRRFIIDPDSEARAERIIEGEEWIKGEEKPPDVPLWKRLWKKYGWEKEDPRANVVIGNLDGEDGE